MAENQQMMTLPEEFDRASIIASCANPLLENVVSQFGQRVIKISDHHVVKSGVGVTIEEAENQRIANECLDSRIVRVPRVDAFFTDEKNDGYLVMEYVKGKVIDPLEDDTLIEKIADVVKYLATFKHDIPGPLGGGISRGLIFSETQDVSFGSLDEMEEWFNSRLFPHNPKLSFKGCELVLCHLDIAPRNFLWQEDGTPCLVDWESAGYYPRLFEFCYQWFMYGKDGAFNSKMVNLMEPLPDYELAQKDAFMYAWGNMIRYSFRSKESRERERRSLDEALKKLGIERRSGPAPVPPMPDYPPEWYEQAERDGIEFTKPTPVDSPSLLPAPATQDDPPRSYFVRFFRAIFYPCFRSSEAT